MASLEDFLECLSSAHYHYSLIFSKFAVPQSLPRSWNFIDHLQLLQILAQQIPSNQRPRVLQPGQQIT